MLAICKGSPRIQTAILESTEGSWTLRRKIYYVAYYTQYLDHPFKPAAKIIETTDVGAHTRQVDNGNQTDIAQALETEILRKLHATSTCIYVDRKFSERRLVTDGLYGASNCARWKLVKETFTQGLQSFCQVSLYKKGIREQNVDWALWGKNDASACTRISAQCTGTRNGWRPDTVTMWSGRNIGARNSLRCAAITSKVGVTIQASSLLQCTLQRWSSVLVNIVGRIVN